MMSSQGMEWDAEGREGNGEDFQALRKEVLSLRESQRQQSEIESSLIKELQRRCDRVIELEVGPNARRRAER